MNLTAVIQALRAGRGLDFLLNDPMTVLVWAYTALALVVWGAAPSAAGCARSARCRSWRRSVRALARQPRRVPEALDAG